MFNHHNSFQSLSIDPHSDRVLVVDDDIIQRELISAHVADAGCVPLVAADGLEALSLMRRHKPGIVIVDRVMPRMDGLELCRSLRKLDHLPHAYVIMLSVRRDSDEVIEAFQAGVDDFLPKPFDPGELLARLHVGVRTVRLQRELNEKVQLASRLNDQLAELNTQLQQLATIDDLTGILNRRGTMDRLRQHFAMSMRYSLPLSVALIDLDGFKQVNDNEGHQAGDEVLRQFAKLLSCTCRASDVVGRIGGDEFLVIMPQTTAEQATKAMERCREAMERSPMAQRSFGRPLSASIGVAMVIPATQSAEDLFRRADEAAYVAKGEGKNRVRLAA